jgi:hypothetical protein
MGCPSHDLFGVDAGVGMIYTDSVEADDFK